MSQSESDDIRSAAELFMNNSRPMAQRSLGGQLPPGFDITRTHSINLITEEFLSGYMQDGRMSVVRRFFCLFVTFDLFFVSLLWLICIMLNGDNIVQAFQKQVIHYTIYTSLFDVVTAAICRFVVLIVFYAIFYVNHWSIIALSTSGSCLFLISKVYVFDWVDSKQQAFEVILIITSFVLSWGEAWFLDCRVIPQERHARRYFSAITGDERSPLIAPFLAAHIERGPSESVANFYSPLDTVHNSDEEEEQDEEYHQMALDCVRRTYDLLESPDWKVEKVTKKGDTIRSKQRDKLGKIYRLTARIKYPAKALMEELFYRIEDVPKWNPTLLESKIVRKINSYTDITYQASVGGGGGIVKSRDFVNLRCLRLLRDGEIYDVEDDSDDEGMLNSDAENSLNRSCEGSVCTISDGDTNTPLPSSVGSASVTPAHFSPGGDDSVVPSLTAFHTLRRSLGAQTFVSEPPTPPPLPIDFAEPPPLEETFEDAKDNFDDSEDDPGRDNSVGSSVGGATKVKIAKDKVWINAAISVDYAKVPPTSKYTRGQNIVTGFACRGVDGKSDACILEWILCLDLKGYIPRYVLDTAYTTFMTDYMKYLRKYVHELSQRRRRLPQC